ncbi:hypothetical protein [Dendrosporobacter sp. 1207_IL3150]|uniref:hypothetical protein n=1 Tax=Dendrosporobacter sp. 1207_IL3150 TaxID=3084054 RepID=UPI002FD9FEE2
MEWYKCKRDIIVIIAVMVLVFFCETRFIEVQREFSDQVETTSSYEVLLVEWGYITTAVFSLLVAAFIHLKHFWQWGILAPFVITSVRVIKQIILSSEETATVHEVAVEIVLNGVLYLPFVLPFMLLLYAVRKKIERR